MSLRKESEQLLCLVSLLQKHFSSPALPVFDRRNKVGETNEMFDLSLNLI